MKVCEVGGVAEVYARVVRMERLNVTLSFSGIQRTASVSHVEVRHTPPAPPVTVLFLEDQTLAELLR